MIALPPPPKSEKVEALITDALDRLPKTADGIARYFTEQGIKGACGHANRCVIAQYLCAEAGVDWVGVVPGAVDVILDSPLEDVRVVNPQHVTDFIVGFDSHRYPELIAS